MPPTKSAFGAAAQEVARVDESLAARQQERLVMAGVQEQFHFTLAERREQRSAARARKSVLEDLENRQEGLGIGVKDILNRARTARMPPWNQVLGSVAELLDADLEQSALVEIALGQRAQAIVIDDLKPLIEYLSLVSIPIAGRVRFVARTGNMTAAESRENQPGPLDRFVESLRLDPAALPDLAAEKGVQCRADSLVRSPQNCPELGEQLLCDTWIVDVLDTAFELSAGAGRGCRFVTLQGELVDSDGTLAVGALRGETTLVSQKSELRRLKQDLLRLDRQIRDDEQRLEQLLVNLNDADSALKSINARLQEAAGSHAQCRIELAERQRELERLSAERQTIEAESQDHQRHLKEALDQLEEAHLKFAILDGEIDSERQQIVLLESQLVEAEERARPGAAASKPAIVSNLPSTKNGCSPCDRIARTSRARKAPVQPAGRGSRATIAACSGGPTPDFPAHPQHELRPGGVFS